MKQDQSQFLAQEYSSLWQEAGIDDAKLLEEIRIRSESLLETDISSSRADPVQPPINLAGIRVLLGDCKRCALSKSRHNIVFGNGNPKPRLAFIGAIPGEQEDKTGMAFSDAAGQLLTNIIEAMGFARDEVYLSTTVKCRASEPRNPLPQEVEACSAFLKLQLQVISPQIIVALGETASQLLSGLKDPIAALRGEFRPLIWNASVMVMPTYDPHHLLKDPTSKRAVWEDMKKVKSRLETKG